MTPALCQDALDQVGSGVAASLYAVDCAASSMAQAAFGRLFGSEGALVPALTIMLTIFIALFGFALITGRSRIGIATLTPRMATLGLVLTFATSWLAYQNVVWNLAIGAPDQLAGIIAGTQGNSTQIFADKIDVVVAALERASGNGIAPKSTLSPLGMMWLGGILLLLGTVGILVTAKIALAILIAIGPVFVTLALFPSTRGLFTGWLKGVVLLALTPLFAVLGGSVMLELAVPIISSLAPTLPGQIDPQAAMAFFMIGAVHMALMVMVMKVATTMVLGWSVFGLAAKTPAHRSVHRAVSRAHITATPASGTAVVRTQTATLTPSRQIRIAPPAAFAANVLDGSPGSKRSTNIVAAIATSPSGTAHTDPRVHGIGSRFRAPPVQRAEKLK